MVLYFKISVTIIGMFLGVFYPLTNFLRGKGFAPSPVGEVWEGGLIIKIQS